MGFGNPYGDDWNVDIVVKWVDRLTELGIKIIQLSDTIGVSNPGNISYLFSQLIPHYEPMGVEIGAHLHTTPQKWEEKVHAAYLNGCRRFDGAIKGFGGCPMAKDELTGNMPMEKVIQYLIENKIETNLNLDAFSKSMDLSSEVFPH